MPATISVGGSSIIATQVALKELGFRIQSFKEPLDISIREVLIPTISENFATQGQGKWDSLAARTLEDKAKMGAPNRMLVRTKKMIIAATQVSSWSFGGSRDSAELNLNKLPEYSTYHITGTRKMPRRDFTEVPAKAIDEVQDIFTTYIQFRINRFHGVR